MTKPLRCALLLGIVLASVAGQASAAVPTMDDDIQVAKEYWGWSRSLWCSSERFEEAPLPLGVAGQTTFAGDGEFPEGVQEVECLVKITPIAKLEEVVALNNLVAEPGLIPAKAREVRCRIVLHEYGHVLHLGHSPDESNPMYWKFTFKPALPGCEARLHEARPAKPRRHRRHHRRRHPLRVHRAINY